MVNKTLQRDWIHALESGNYKQGTGRLRSTNDAYCCMGVACAVKNPKLFKPHDEDHYRWRDLCQISALPKDLKAELGLEDSEMWALIDLNDISNESFESIAQTLRALFEIWD